MITVPSLISWSDSSIDGVRYFSGTATYSKTFAADPAWLRTGRRMALDLGEVQVMARVKLNGRDLGILWKPPYRVEITGAIEAGKQRTGNQRRQPLAQSYDWRRGIAREPAVHVEFMGAFRQRHAALEIRVDRPRHGAV